MDPKDYIKNRGQEVKATDPITLSFADEQLGITDYDLGDHRLVAIPANLFLEFSRTSASLLELFKAGLPYGAQIISPLDAEADDDMKLYIVPTVTEALSTFPTKLDGVGIAKDILSLILARNLPLQSISHQVGIVAGEDNSIIILGE